MRYTREQLREITVEKIWQNYRKNVVPADASRTQVLETKRAFLAGFAICFEVMCDVSEAFSEDDAEAFLKKLEREYFQILERKELFL